MDTTATSLCQAILRYTSARLLVAATPASVDKAVVHATGAAWLMHLNGQISGLEQHALIRDVEHEAARTLAELPTYPVTPSASSHRIGDLPLSPVIGDAEGTSIDRAAVDALTRALRLLDASMTGTQCRAAIQQLIADRSADRPAPIAAAA